MLGGGSRLIATGLRVRWGVEVPVFVSSCLLTDRDRKSGRIELFRGGCRVSGEGSGGVWTWGTLGALFTESSRYTAGRRLSCVCGAGCGATSSSSSGEGGRTPPRLLLFFFLKSPPTDLHLFNFGAAVGSASSDHTGTRCMTGSSVFTRVGLRIPVCLGVTGLLSGLCVGEPTARPILRGSDS